MRTTVEVGRGEFGFSAAHTGLHEGEFEPLHGHAYQVTLRLFGTPGDDGMLTERGRPDR
jgi:6-pyruvoyl-tetrahydropterin synthase